MNNILYCFVSHEKKIDEDIYRISSIMNNINYNHYIIVYSSQTKKNYQNKIINIGGDDSWCGLPEKINRLFKYVSDNYNYDFYVKLDRTVVVKKIIQKKDCVDYGGFIHHFNSSADSKWKQYHLGKCGDFSLWNNKEFDGPELRFCSGVSYMLSKNSAGIIAKDNIIYKDHIYEDYYVGTLLKANNIDAKYIPIKQYYYDPEHRWMFK